MYPPPFIEIKHILTFIPVDLLPSTVEWVANLFSAPVAHQVAPLEAVPLAAAPSTVRTELAVVQPVSSVVPASAALPTDTGKSLKVT
jgi:hypothetical protein